MQYKNFIPTSLEKNLEPLQYPDCIHLDERFRCRILRVDKCPKECSFCQNHTQRVESDKRWFAQMNTISEERQIQIAMSYYGGKMPWKNRGEGDKRHV